MSRHPLEKIFRDSIQACDLQRAVSECRVDSVRGRTLVVAVGKSAAVMASGFAQSYQGEFTGMAVVLSEDTSLLPNEIVRWDSAHPYPDERSVRAAEYIIQSATALGENDQLVFLLSGGASSLICLPRGITLSEKGSGIRELMLAGANIEEINIVRKHLSSIKGGRLAQAAFPAKVITFIASDVTGDELGVIGSGPTVADGSTISDARAVLKKYGLDELEIAAALKRADKSPREEKPDKSIGHKVENILVMTNQELISQSKKRLEGLGYQVIDIRIDVTGCSKDEAYRLSELYRTLKPGEAVISGGETTVDVKGKGRGGPNLEVLLNLAILLKDETDYLAMAADSDGSDGSSGIAGAVADGSTLMKAKKLNLDPKEFLCTNDAGSFFENIGDTIITGPTGVNLNDLRILAKARQ